MGAQRTYLTFTLLIALVVSGLGCSRATTSVSSSQVVHETSPASSSNVTSSEIHRLHVLPEIMSVTVIDASPGSDRKAISSTDAMVIRDLVEHLTSATFFGDSRASVGRTIDGSYILLLGLRSGEEIGLTWWNDGQTPNLLDMGQQEWWIVSGLQPVLQPLLPKPPGS